VPSLQLDTDQRDRLALAICAVAALIAGGLAVGGGAPTAAVPALVAAIVLVVMVRRTGRIMLTDGELDQLRSAELALSRATGTEEAARELADHAIALLGARSAVVLIEGIGDTVRVAAGPKLTEDVYGSGSRMRLLDDAGVPCGSIAVSARADGRPYSARHERILDALAERVSTTLHQVSLLTEVQAERKKLAELIGSSSDGIFSVGSDMRVRLWNPAMERITGVSPDVALGEHVTESFRPTDASGAVRYGSGDPGRSGELVDALLVSIDAGDEERWLTCSYAPLSDGGYVVIARDDTERKKLQDDKDGWIAQVSHELRTPLTPIKGFLHTLVKRDADLATADRRKIYDIMLREEQRLEDLVNSLLRSTQLDQGAMVVSLEELDWVSVVRQHVESFQRQDPSRTIDVVVEGRMPAVLADESVASGVLTNLLSNALKYAETGTPIEVVMSADDDVVVTSVVDHGPGVPRSDQERIFDKFTRLGDHLTRRQQGVGLGLYIAKRSVEELGGQVWVDNTPGGGATFRFTLPSTNRRPALRADEPATSATGAPAVTPRRSRPIRR
jgi:PAS domain S-box-containing protein